MTDLQPGTVQIGPVGLDIPLYVPEAGDWRGETGTLTGSFAGDDQDAALALRSQFLGLAALEGQLVVCRFADRPELDGWYTLGDTSHGTDGASFAHGMFDYSVRVTRARAWQQLAQQERLLGAVRSQPDSTANDHGIDGGDITPWHSPGVAPLGYRLDAGTVAGGLDFASADGNVVVYTDTEGTFLNNTARWHVRPPGFYLGSCRVMEIPDGSPKGYRVVGSQMSNRPEGWAMTNGLVAVQPAGGQLRFRWWNGDGWVSPKTLAFVLNSVPLVEGLSFDTVRVVWESPERCSLRVLADSPNAGQIMIDLGIRRGSRTVTVAMVSVGGDPVDWSFLLDTGEDLDDHTGGWHALTADDDDNKVIINSPSEWAGDLTLADPARSAAIGIGCEIGTVPPGCSPATFTDETWMWFAAMSSHQRPVIA